MIKVKCNGWRVLPSSLDGIELLFIYSTTNMGESSDLKKDIPEEQRSIKVSISGSRAITWGFQIWQFSQPGYYNDLAKLLYEFAKIHITEKIKDGTLKQHEEIFLLTSNSTTNRPYDVNLLNEPSESEFVIETMPKENISEEIQQNQLAASIIEKRDIINAIFHQTNKAKLFTIDEERRILEFFRTANTLEEFSHRVTSLGGLVGQINIDVLKTILLNDQISGSINYLEKYLISIKCNWEPIITPLRKINRIRQSFPVHNDIAGIIEGLKYFDIDYPVENYQLSWQKLLQGYHKVLEALLTELKNSLLKK